MRINSQHNMSIEDLSALFSIPVELIIAANANIPGYEMIFRKFKTRVQLEDYCKEHEVTMEMIKLVNETLDLENISIPIRVRELTLANWNEYTYDKLVDDIAALQRIYPFIAIDVIGKSILSKNIFEIRIGRGPIKSHFNASFHGNEWITSSLLMKTVNQYLLDLTNNEEIVPYFSTHTISIVPMVNPDGVNLAIKHQSAAEKYEQDVLKINNNNPDFSNWKANIVGVDLNKQFPALWNVGISREVSRPHYRDYPGKVPLSEPEAIAMQSLVEKNEFDSVFAYHTQGAEIYWGFQGLEPMVSEKIAEDFEKVTNYEAVRYVNNYGGFKDWFIKKYNKPGFTIEFGKGRNPLPFNQFDQMYSKSLAIFYEHFRKVKGNGMTS